MSKKRVRVFETVTVQRCIDMKVPSEWSEDMIKDYCEGNMDISDFEQVEDNEFYYLYETEEGNGDYCIKYLDDEDC